MEALQWVADELQISKPEDWFHVKFYVVFLAHRVDQELAIRCNGIEGLLGEFLCNLLGLRDQYNGIVNALQKIYPNYDWISLQRDFSLNKDIMFSKAQLGLFKCIKELFPEVSDLHYNYPHPGLGLEAKVLSNRIELRDNKAVTTRRFHSFYCSCI